MSGDDDERRGSTSNRPLALVRALLQVAQRRGRGCPRRTRAAERRQRVKPAHDVKPGDAVTIELGAHGDEREITIAAIPARRGPASEAATCYVESSASVERRRAAAEARALAPPPPTAGRPDKRTRRLLLRARDRR